ncbi:MAG: murein DD-endopeptidase MepM/ murein hydrolase activator NlpD [Candidatus Azotimanducaceae bacterium]|jgi:murein DD-endopeptidase MepM/ murein hydrolase activator NlpD
MKDTFEKGTTQTAPQKGSTNDRKSSRKALEYRVFWLERKLTLQQSDQRRSENVAKIDNLPASPMKELMHLNNEFQRANEQARGLKDLTQEINSDALKTIERTQRINEVSLGKIADAERINQQSKRLQERTRKINNETVRTANVARQINQSTKAAIETSQRINKETQHFNGLSQAQHDATDRLNRRTEQVNLHGIAVANEGLKLNEVLLKAQAQNETLSGQSVALHTIMKRTRTEFMALNEEAHVLRQETGARFESMDELAQVCQQAVAVASQIETDGQAMLDRGDALLTTTDELNQVSAANVQKFADLAHETEQLISQTQAKTRTLLDHQTQKLHNLQSGVRDDLASLHTETDAALQQCLTQADQTLLVLDSDIRATNASAVDQVMCDHQQLGHHLREAAEVQSKHIDALAAKTSAQLITRIDALAQQSEGRVARAVAESHVEASAFDAVARRSIADLLEKTDTDGRLSLQHFEAQADKTLRVADDRIARLENRAVHALDETESFVNATTKINEASRQILDEGDALNSNSIELQQRCTTALNEVDVAMAELTAAQSVMQRDAHLLAQASKTLNQQRQTQQTQTEQLNEQAQLIQRDSVHTQELSQEINEHSLALHTESRNIQLAFDTLNDDNQTLLQHLTRLRGQLEEQLNLAIEHRAQSQKTQQSAIKTNTDSSNLNAETRLLNDQTLNIIQDARSAVRETQGLNKDALLLSHEIRDARRELEQIREATLNANTESRQATAEARQTIVDSDAMRRDLASSAEQISHLQTEASLELDRLQQQRLETIDVTHQSKQAFVRLEHCIENAEQINDDFLRGLQAANQQHTETEVQAQDLLSETHKLQLEMQDVLSLREGIGEFRTNIDRCQTRLDQYSDALSSCQHATTTHSELFDEYQGQLAQYQADTQGHQNAVLQFDGRTRRLESFFKDYDQRLDALEQKIQADGQLEKLNAPLLQHQLQDQAQQLKRYELLIRNELDAGAAALQATTESIEHQTRLEMERMSKQWLQQFNQMLKGSTDALNQDVSRLDTQTQTLSTGQEAQRLQIQLLQQQAQRQELETGQAASRRESSDVRDQVADINHRLSNYQLLLETQLESTADDLMTQRVGALEARIDEQQARLRAQAIISETQPQAQVGSDDMLQMKAMISEFSQAMDQSVATNEALKLSIGDSAETSEQLLNTNKQLQTRLSQSVKEQARLTRDYESRILALKARETKVAHAVAEIKVKETDADQTMQQMRLAMKASTRAMRDTQKTLERLQQPAELSPLNAAQKASDKPRRWADSPRQAVLSSLAAVVLTAASMFGIFGYQNVDAALPLTGQLLIPQPAALVGLDSRLHQTAPVLAATTGIDPIKQAGFVEPSLDSLYQARDSISRLGEFAWPLNSGIVDADTVQYRPYHQGITIRGELGDPIVAVNDGQVIYSADEIRGYGNVIVIQHDDSLLSVYANNQFNYVKQGDAVRRGQLIGDVGQLLEEKTTGLYFEMRYEGAAQDPFNYLAESLQADSSS